MAYFHRLVPPRGLGHTQGDQLRDWSIPHLGSIGDDQTAGVLRPDGFREQTDDPGIGRVVDTVGLVEKVETHFPVGYSLELFREVGPVLRTNFQSFRIGPKTFGLMGGIDAITGSSVNIEAGMKTIFPGPFHPLIQFPKGFRDDDPAVIFLHPEEAIHGEADKIEPPFSNHLEIPLEKGPSPTAEGIKSKKVETPPAGQMSRRWD